MLSWHFQLPNGPPLHLSADWSRVKLTRQRYKRKLPTPLLSWILFGKASKKEVDNVLWLGNHLADIYLFRMICFQKVTFRMSLNLNLHNLQACTLLISQDKETVVTNHFNLKTVRFKIKAAMFLIEPLCKVFTRLWSRHFKIQTHHISWSSKCSELLWQKACRGTRGENSWKYHWSVKCPNTWSCFSLQQERKLKKDRNCKSSLQKRE